MKGERRPEAPPNQPFASVPADREGKQSRALSGSSERLRLRRLVEVHPRQVRWLLPGLIPLKTITLVAGVGGLGKSTWLAGVAARVSQGEVGGRPANVLLVSFEDTAAEVLRPRVEAAGGNLSRIYEVVVGELEIDPLRLPRDLVDLEALIAESHARLVVIDPIVAALDTAIDAHKDQHVRVILAKLAGLAEHHRCAVVLVGHLNKAPSREAYLRIGGSTAFYNAARSVVLVTRDRANEPDLRLIAQEKANYARRKPVERHRIEEIALPMTTDAETGEPIITSRMVFVEIADDIDDAEVLAPRESATTNTREAEATRFLGAELAGGGWCESAPIKDRAEAAGIAARTLQRAMRELDIEVERRGFPSVTYWRLSHATFDPERLARLPNRPSHAASGLNEGAVTPVAPVVPAVVKTNASTNGLCPEFDPVQEELDYYRGILENAQKRPGGSE
jgi:hypothetical protein